MVGDRDDSLRGYPYPIYSELMTLGVSGTPYAVCLLIPSASSFSRIPMLISRAGQHGCI